MQSFSVLCIPTRGTHITSDMCAGVHISRGYTYHCDTAVGTQSRSQGHLGFQNGGIFESREVPGIKVLLHVKDKLSENFLKIFLVLLGYAPYFWRFKDLS